MFLVLGLGNPEAKYVDTRHNVGFLVVDALARRGMVSCDISQHGALVNKVRMQSETVVLAKPQSYMNRSGGPGQMLRGYYKLDLDKVIVVHDELDLPFGAVRIKRGGGHGGHNVLRDLHQKFAAPDYLRVRVGIGRPPSGWKTANYVLGRWSNDEALALADVVATAADAVTAIVQDGSGPAMNHFNIRPGRGRSTDASPSRAQAPEVNVQSSNSPGSPE